MKQKLVFLFMLKDAADSRELHCFIPDKCLYVVAAYMYFTNTIITFLHILQVLFFINVYMVLFLFDNVMYVFLLLRLFILIVCLCMTTLTEVFPCFSSVVRQMPG